jgi:hypothetical protein
MKEETAHEQIKTEQKIDRQKPLKITNLPPENSKTSRVHGGLGKYSIRWGNAKKTTDQDLHDISIP